MAPLPIGADDDQYRVGVNKPSFAWHNDSNDFVLLVQLSDIKRNMAMASFGKSGLQRQVMHTSCKARLFGMQEMPVKIGSGASPLSPS